MLAIVEPAHTMTASNQEVTPDLSGKSCVVIGMGKSGVAAARLLKAIDAVVTVVDEHETEPIRETEAALAKESIRCLTGKMWRTALEQAEWIVLSPGVPVNLPELVLAREQGIPIVGEMELASWFLNIPIISITGTNGKSTTVRLIGEFLQASGKHVFVGGNLGIPLCEAVLAQRASSHGAGSSEQLYEYAVVEASSFQLETIQRFRPWIAAILNVTPDHLDRHATFEEYFEAKWKIFENQTREDFAIINADDSLLAVRAGMMAGTVMAFSLRGTLPAGVWLEGSTVMARVHGQAHEVVRREDIALRGVHNLANVLAATVVGLLCGCPLEDLRRVMKSFQGTEHVLEYVRTYQGVKYYNDSKGTNVDATQKALASFDEPVILIIGGKDKGGDFGLLGDRIRQHVKAVVAIGEATKRITRSLAGIKSVEAMGSLQEAVRYAQRMASAGDVVLFSPSCSSFDMFRNYDHRGKEFKRLVHELPDIG
ncbi:MAG: UDP-N-acetylmuramoyl-L-alanine--D-glutamate ligase [Nitrospirales bacterium]|nr:UDP-N-acetylmuramoyl-L-alanine--D-glutamate ligase [Nitrospira sp.]MDR4500467.1 UDP-N-acetylmuramoyl-L-alanine--D-glutamate ligase [Nitrospirales bacterium]